MSRRSFFPPAPGTGLVGVTPAWGDIPDKPTAFPPDLNALTEEQTEGLVAETSYTLPDVTGAVARSAVDRESDRISAFEFMTSAQRTDVRERTMGVDVSPALQAGIDYCQPLGIELFLPLGEYRLDSRLEAYSSGHQVGLRMRGAGPTAGYGALSGTNLSPTFTNDVVLDIDGAGTTYQFQWNGWLRQFSIRPSVERSGLVGIRMVAGLNWDFSHLLIERMGSHAILFPQRPDKIAGLNPDAYCSGFIDFRSVRILRNGGWGLRQTSGIGAFNFFIDNCYICINRKGGVYLSGPSMRVFYSTVSSNGQDDNQWGWGILVERRAGSIANTTIRNCELDSNWAGNVWLQSSNGASIIENRHNSWQSVWADGHLRPPVHIRLGGSNAASQATRIDCMKNNHRSQNVAAGATAERQLTWYQMHDTSSSVFTNIRNPFNDSQTANVQRYSRSGGALATAAIGAGAVTGITVVHGGLGYFTVPTVSFSGGGGTGAAATAVTDGKVVQVVLTDPGRGFGSVPTVGFSGGGGSGAAATAVLNEWNGIEDVVITDGGTGYTSAPTVSITGGSPTGAATAQAVYSKVVSSFTITNGGSGYTTVPAVIIVPEDFSATNTSGYECEIIDGNDLVLAAPITPQFRVRDTAGTISVAGTGTTSTRLTYATEIFDPDALYATGVITIPYTGVFWISASVSFVSLTPGTTVEMTIVEAGAVRDLRRRKAVGVATAIGGGAGGESFTIEGSYFFTKGATAEVKCLTNEGSAKTISTGTGENSIVFFGVA
jgi:hypothetical protein